MTIYSRPSKDPKSIFLGRADIYVGPYLDYITDTDLALPESAYIGNTLTTNFNYDRVTNKVRNVLSNTAVRTSYTYVDVSVDCEMNELSRENLSLLYGTSFAANNEIALGITTEVYYRVELVFEYPDKNRKMHIIIPKASIDSVDALRFINEGNTRPNLTIGANDASLDNAVWNSFPAARILISGF